MNERMLADGKIKKRRQYTKVHDAGRKSLPQLQLLVRELMCPSAQRTPPDGEGLNVYSQQTSVWSLRCESTFTKSAWFGSIYWKTLPQISISDLTHRLLISPWDWLLELEHFFIFFSLCPCMSALISPAHMLVSLVIVVVILCSLWVVGYMIHIVWWHWCCTSTVSPFTIVLSV